MKNEITLQQATDNAKEAESSMKKHAEESEYKKQKLQNPEQITIDDAKKHAILGVAREAYLAELGKPAYPDQPAEPTVFERIAAFFTGKKSAALLREEIELEKAKLHGLDDRADAKKHAQQEAYTVALAEISCWRDTEAANCKANITKLQSQLRLLEAGK